MLRTTLEHELQLIWSAHARVGLQGKMCLYSIPGSFPWPTKTPGIVHWFGPDETASAIDLFLEHYNNGAFPYTPLLLNPIVHHHAADGSYQPIGSGMYWATCLAVNPITPDKFERLSSTGASVGYIQRAETDQCGLKLVAFSDVLLAPLPSHTVAGCQELYDLANISGDDYRPYYLLGGVGYLSNAGVYTTPDVATQFGSADALARHTVPVATTQSAALCWERYDRHATLYTRFGNDVAGLEKNLKLYDYCARDFELFDAIGPQSVKTSSQEEGGFEFLVHGLIPRGSIVLLAGTGGTGKSSIAHKLCCLAATDWRDDEQPLWLGQPVNKKLSKGICVYFSGEDGPAIINARNEIFDPEKRAQRLMFQRNHFTDANGGEITFAEFLARLKKMPEVPLLVIDPARKYLTGDEDDAAVVSEFFEAIEKFAHERNTAVIVVHHLSKGARPQSAREVLDELRGSQVFIDRPRVVIGMFREGPKTVVGLAKCNIPPSLGMVTDERVFAHNPKTLDLTQLPGKEGVRQNFSPISTDEEA